MNNLWFRLVVKGRKPSHRLSVTDNGKGHVGGGPEYQYSGYRIGGADGAVCGHTIQIHGVRSRMNRDRGNPVDRRGSGVVVECVEIPVHANGIPRGEMGAACRK